jgi:hypothetical protein
MNIQLTSKSIESNYEENKIRENKFSIEKKENGDIFNYTEKSFKNKPIRINDNFEKKDGIRNFNLNIIKEKNKEKDKDKDADSNILNINDKLLKENFFKTKKDYYDSKEFKEIKEFKSSKRKAKNSSREGRKSQNHNQESKIGLIKDIKHKIIIKDNSGKI